VLGVASSENGLAGARNNFLALLIATCVVLSGCSGRPKDFLIPVDASLAPPGASKVEMLVATTRSDTGAAPGQMFTGERGGRLSYADIAVSIPPESVRKVGDVQWPSTTPGDPAREFVTLRADQLDHQAALAKFGQRLAQSPGRRVLVFIHGYNTRFEEAVYRYAQFIHDSQAPLLPVLFTWPSRGKLLAYTYDRESANYSRDALEKLLQTLSDDKNVGEINVLAHSMGNWVTLEALRQMAIRKGRIAPKIMQVMLAAPDVDFDVFRRQIAEIGNDRPPFTLFVSGDDEALAVSRRVWGNRARLGAVDPEAEPYRSELARDRITAFDLTRAKSSDSLNHAKFAESPVVVRLIGQKLASGQALSDGKASMGEKIGQFAAGAASTAGKVAGVAISAPLAVIDADTRESFGDRIQDLGPQADDTTPIPSDISNVRHERRQQ
jgi:esterase/lipase superfamily enzyme